MLLFPTKFLSLPDITACICFVTSHLGQEMADYLWQWCNMSGDTVDYQLGGHGRTMNISNGHINEIWEMPYQPSGTHRPQLHSFTL